MANEELKIKLTELLPMITFEEGGQWLTLQLTPAEWASLAHALKSIPSLNFDYLFCLTCIDWKTHLTMVYHLESTALRHSVVVKCKLDRNKPEIATCSTTWKAAEFLEREVYELFGVIFLAHPDLRLLILPEGWEGKYPLRKDFEDAVNMIKL